MGEVAVVEGCEDGPQKRRTETPFVPRFGFCADEDSFPTPESPQVLLCACHSLRTNTDASRTSTATSRNRTAASVPDTSSSRNRRAASIQPHDIPYTHVPFPHIIRTRKVPWVDGKEGPGDEEGEDVRGGAGECVGWGR